MHANTPSDLQIDVVSDIVCPWCYIGKRQLDAAVRAWRSAHPTRPAPVVIWRPFQLSPDVPAGGIDRVAHMRRKFGEAGLAQAHARLRTIGEPLGITFDFDAIRVQPNTLKAHALIELAAGAHQSLLAEALFEAFFVQGRNLADDATLRDIALGADVSLSAEQVDAALAGDSLTRVVAAAEAELREYGINGVPFFLIGQPGRQRQAISGAQGSSALLAAMNAAMTASNLVS